MRQSEDENIKGVAVIPFYGSVTNFITQILTHTPPPRSDLGSDPGQVRTQVSDPHSRVPTGGQQSLADGVVPQQ